ncbi:MAG: hypothetical protein QGH90_05095 [Candidatus Poseidoniaceae archaeon]|nr:hypothetical protein [Candidatus Poseidoniaceae archaeon]
MPSPSQIEEAVLKVPSQEMTNSKMFIYSLPIVLTILLLPSTLGYSNGITGASVEDGCNCHGGGIPSNDVSVELEGLPSEFVPNQIYNLTITIIGGPEVSGLNQAGYNLQVSSGVLSTLDDNSKIQQRQATHTSSGNDMRQWVVTWMAPNSESSTDFSLLGNSVNGDSVPNQADHWNQFEITINSVDFEQDNANIDETGNSSFPIMPLIIGTIAALFVVRWLPDDL